MSEALDKPLASAMGMKSLLVSTPVGVANGVAEQGEALLRAPSLLNGGAFNKYMSKYTSVYFCIRTNLCLYIG